MTGSHHGGSPPVDADTGRPAGPVPPNIHDEPPPRNGKAVPRCQAKWPPRPILLPQGSGRV